MLLSVFVIICTFFAPKLCISLPYFYPSFAIQLRNLSPLSFTTCSKSLTHCFILATLSVFCHLSKKISTMFGSMILMYSVIISTFMILLFPMGFDSRYVHSRVYSTRTNYLVSQTFPLLQLLPNTIFQIYGIFSVYLVLLKMFPSTFIQSSFQIGHITMEACRFLYSSGLTNQIDLFCFTLV